MKIKRNTNSLQNQLAKMLQAGKENVDNSSDNEKVIEQNRNAPLHANTQADTYTAVQTATQAPVEEQVPATTAGASTRRTPAATQTTDSCKTPKNNRRSIKGEKGR